MPASSTVSAFSAAKKLAARASVTRAMTEENASSLPTFSSGFSIQLSQLKSFSSKMKSRKIISRKMPPKAAIAGLAASRYWAYVDPL